MEDLPFVKSFVVSNHSRSTLHESFREIFHPEFDQPLTEYRSNRACDFRSNQTDREAKKVVTVDGPFGRRAVGQPITNTLHQYRHINEANCARERYEAQNGIDLVKLMPQHHCHINEVNATGHHINQAFAMTPSCHNTTVTSTIPSLMTPSQHHCHINQSFAMTPSCHNTTVTSTSPSP